MKPLIVIGTRPEAIKLAPVCRALPEAEVLLTGQQPSEMVFPVLEYFGFKYTKNCSHIASSHIDWSFRRIHEAIASQVDTASCVIAQGDTMTALAAAVSAFYSRTPFVHVEAGLRTYREVPFPEEFNRRVCGLAARIHCCPTRRAAENLCGERVAGRILVTGNTVVDAIQYTLDREADAIARERDEPPRVLITCHRRENFGEAFENVCNAVCYLAAHHRDVRFVWAVHPNPNARPKAMPGIELIDPPDYPNWVRMMATSRLILTDSGGIQEEAAVLGKQCLVMRDLTERPEAVECGACRMVGTETQAIVEAVDAALTGAPWMMKPHPFGDGTAAEQIAELVRELCPT